MRIWVRGATSGNVSKDVCRESNELFLALQRSNTTISVHFYCEPAFHASRFLILCIHFWNGRCWLMLHWYQADLIFLRSLLCLSHTMMFDILLLWRCLLLISSTFIEAYSPSLYKMYHLETPYQHNLPILIIEEAELFHCFYSDKQLQSPWWTLFLSFFYCDVLNMDWSYLLELCFFTMIKVTTVRRVGRGSISTALVHFVFICSYLLLR